MDTTLQDRCSQVLGAHPVDWQPAVGGYTAAERWVCRLDDGRSVFIKTTAIPGLAERLRREYDVYAQLHAPFMAKLLGWHDDGRRPMLILEDLSQASWPPPWDTERVERVGALIESVLATAPLANLPRFEDRKEEIRGWSTVAEDPAPFLRLGLSSPLWLDSSLQGLLRAEDAADLGGDSLVHADVRSDNLCFDGPRTLLIDWDWNDIGIGNPRLMRVSWLPSLAYEGGIEPEALCEPEDGPLAALLAGHFAARAGLPPSMPGSRARIIQLNQLRTALPWACGMLGLPPPDLLPSGQPWNYTR